MKKTVAVVGLGLIGGSLASAMKGFEDYEVLGVVRREETGKYALEHGICDRVTMDLPEALGRAEVVFLCMDPAGIVDTLKKHRGAFRPGALVCDVAGIKTAIMAAADTLPEGVDFIGCHPMAGTEFSGIENSFPEMFRKAHFLITPRETSTEEHIQLLHRMAGKLGCADVIKTTPQRHDDIIAYTSQMMHIVALSVCDDAELFQCRGFEGSSFRDCTRVAALDVPLWTQLMTMNADALTRVIRRLEENIHAYRVALEHQDVERMTAKLTYSSQRKRRMSFPGPGQVKLED